MFVRIVRRRCVVLDVWHRVSWLLWHNNWHTCRPSVVDNDAAERMYWPSLNLLLDKPLDFVPIKHLCCSMNCEVERQQQQQRQRHFSPDNQLIVFPSDRNDCFDNFVVVLICTNLLSTNCSLHSSTLMCHSNFRSDLFHNLLLIVDLSSLLSIFDVDRDFHSTVLEDFLRDLSMMFRPTSMSNNRR